MPRTLLIGDIHGCYHELQDLLERAALSADDRVIALGDIVDRGHESPAVVDFFRQRWDASEYNARSLLGNHERKHLRSARGEIKAALSQQIARKQLGPAYPAALSLFETLPPYLELPQAILVHGYLEPGIPLAQQRITVITGARSGEAYLTSRYPVRWYELYQGDKPVIFGHDDILGNGQPFVYQDRAIGLDTSCVLGKHLTGLLLPEFQFVSVPAAGNHWFVVRQAHAPAQTKNNRSAPSDNHYDLPWAEEWEDLLDQLLEYVRQEKDHVLAELNSQASYSELSPRRQALEFASRVHGSPAQVLLQLARRGELARPAARRFLRDEHALQALVQTLGLTPYN